MLRPALDDDPRQAALNLLMAELRLGARQTDAALALYEQTLAWYPRHAPTILEYASALIASGKPERARQLLLTNEQCR